MKAFSVVGNFLLGSLFTLLLISEFAFKENNIKSISKNNQWSVPVLPEQISFANEKAPVERWDVKEKFDKEFLQLYYAPGAILYLVKLANRNFPIISERLKANGSLMILNICALQKAICRVGPCQVQVQLAIGSF